MNKAIFSAIIASGIIFVFYLFLFPRPAQTFPNQVTQKKLFEYLPSAIILQYHHIANDTPNATSTSVALFKQQLDLLETLNFKVLPLSTIINNLRNGEQLPERVVALTFDDAYINFYENAWPLLKQHGYPATLFVATTHISEEATEFLSWSQLEELSKTGIEIGSHSHSHNFLARELHLNNSVSQQNTVVSDIQLSLNKIQQRLSITTNLFAYPYGEYSIALGNIIAEMKLIGFAQHSGPINRFSNYSALPRFPASNDFGEIESLKEKLLTRPFTDFSHKPTEPFTPINPPLLEMNFSDNRLKVSCFATSTGAIPVSAKIKGSILSIKTKAPKPLSEGRSRYNCTAPAKQGYFFWFSQPWVIVN